MKLKIKTLNQKSLVLDIEDTKTVYELKKELSLYPDVGVHPDLQKLIYAGKILINEDKLSTYNIDVKKFLVVMILKRPLEDELNAVKPCETDSVNKDTTDIKETPKESGQTPTIPVIESEFKVPTATANKKDELVSQIVAMGYPESDVRRALAASFYSPERAIEYLIEGIPTSSATTEGESYSDTDADDFITPFEVFRGDPMLQGLRNALQQNPELLDAAIQRVGETNPGLLNLISENQQEFLSLLVDSSGDEEYEDNDIEGDVDD